MSRGRLVTLVVVLLALVTAVFLRFPGRSPAPPLPAANPSATAVPSVPPARLAALRTAADLDPCPASLGRDLPDLVLPCLGGGPAMHLRGPGTGVPTLVNIYGSWCGPCQDEMPNLVAFSRLAGERVRLVGIDDEDDPAQALPFARDYGQHWPAVQDDNKRVLPRYASGPPVTLFVDGGGRTVYVKIGPFRRLADLRGAVLEHLGVRV